MEAGFLQPFAESHESNAKNPGCLGDLLGMTYYPAMWGL